MRIKEGHDTNLSEDEVQRILSLKAPLTVEDELKVIESFGLSVDVLCEGAYIVTRQKYKIYAPYLQQMLRSCTLLVPIDDTMWNSGVYGIITRFDDNTFEKCINKVAEITNNRFSRSTYDAECWEQRGV